jgi:hypothetical protein
MGKKSPSPPPAPDPMATAQAQGQVNADTARLQGRMNRLDQVTPYGSVTYDDIGNDRSRVTTALSPAQQRLLDLTNQAQELYGTAALSQLGQVRDALSRPFQYDGPAVQTSLQDRSGGVAQGYYDRNGEVQRNTQDRTGEVQRSVIDRTGDVMRRADFTGIGDPNQSREAVQGALFARMNPQLETQRAALEARLVNQGITPGSAAWETGMRDYAQQANDARYGAILNAGQEQSRVFGLGFGQTNLNNQAVGQQMGNDLDRGRFANEATQMVMNNDLARGQFANSATNQLNQSDLQRLGFQNQATQQLYGMDLGRAQFGNGAVQQSLQQQLALRGQPINEAAALLSGQQIQYPQFQNAPQVQIQAPDYQSMVLGNYGVANSQYNAALQRQASDRAAIAQLGGQALGAAGMAFGRFA